MGDFRVMELSARRSTNWLEDPHEFAQKFEHGEKAFIISEDSLNYLISHSDSHFICRICQARDGLIAAIKSVEDQYGTLQVCTSCNEKNG